MNEIKIKAAGEADVVIGSDGSLNVTIPIKITRRGRRKAVMLPDGTTFQPREWDGEPTQVQLALARGYRWLGLLESGKARNLTEVAQMEGMDPAYVSRMVNLTTLAPDIVAAILDETLPDHVILFDLASGTPLLWDEQRASIGLLR
ncbi:MAG: hypothetical protein EWV88_21845 [Microcystis wesenbergii Mw_MB_S_20031200_S109D]|uniref:LacI family transcriptional regulator n=1 Tax=Microcystis wesenbergii Mw_MB_S_20031200_S109D TaxID=2486241 RepID=A0A552LC71_9CHRO|nr:MAG: hypothetical protein EWV88_21845 [Microcystis wesenbergii Mw_MB_S_20031200_S109D]